MSAVTTHVLDVSRGRPATGVEVRLARRDGDGRWEEVAAGPTDDDGRVDDLLPEGAPVPEGVYRIRFEVGDYFERSATEAFYPRIDVVFRVAEPSEHYHVPILLGPFGYTTYRGS